MRPILGWTMLSRAEMRQVERSLANAEQDTRDEIGFLLIHQGFADRFFPGTSVLHSYGGSDVPMDPTLVEEMVRVIESGHDDGLLRGESSKEFAAKLQRMRPYVGWNRLPVARDSHGDYHFFTFGGRVLNGVIARWAGLQSYEVDDIVVRADKEIEFTRLPTQPGELADLAALALQIPGERTVCQNILPVRLLVRELRDVWLKAPVSLPKTLSN